MTESTIVIQEEELAKTFNEFFVSIVKNLGINENRLSTFNSETDNVESVVAKFEYYLVLWPYVIVLIRIVHSPLKKLSKKGNQRNKNLDMKKR